MHVAVGIYVQTIRAYKMALSCDSELSTWDFDKRFEKVGIVPPWQRGGLQRDG